MRYDLSDDIRVRKEEDGYALVVFGMMLEPHPYPETANHRAETLRAAIGRRLTAAYYQFSIELRDRLRWVTGAGAEETMKQVCQMKTDLDEAHADILSLRDQLEGLESERFSVLGMIAEKDRQIDRLRKENDIRRQVIDNYGEVLKRIQDSTTDAESRQLAMSVLYQEGQ